MSQLFLYTPMSGVSPGDLKAMRKAGIVPVCVASLDAVRLMQPEVAPVPANEALRCAMTALTGPDNLTAHARERFTHAFARAVERAAAKPSPREAQS